LRPLLSLAPLFPYTTLFRSPGRTWIAETDVVFNGIVEQVDLLKDHRDIAEQTVTGHVPHILTAYCDFAAVHIIETGNQVANRGLDRKSTRLNSSHVSISYAV